MENSGEPVWKKYNARLLEIEYKLAGKICKAGFNENSYAENVQGTSIANAKAGDGPEVQAKLNALESENEKLKEEARFLKMEIEGNIHLKQELCRVEIDYERVSRQKDSEISKLYAKINQLEKEAYDLRFLTKRRGSELLEEVEGRIKERSENAENKKEFVRPDISSTENTRVEVKEKRGNTGLIEWLSKPLITIRS